jgi:hypothetical protein
MLERHTSSILDLRFWILDLPIFDLRFWILDWDEGCMLAGSVHPKSGARWAFQNPKWNTPKSQIENR